MAAKYLTKWRPGFVESQTAAAAGNNATAALPPAVPA